MNLSSLSSSVNSIKSSGVTALSSIASTTYSIVTNEKEKCDICSLDVSKGQATIGLITLERCTLCLKKCCGKCITKNKELLPDKVKEALGKDSLEWVCVNCEPIITQLYMKAFKQTFCDELDNKVHSFFEQNEIPLLLYKQPGPVEDSLSRQFYRFAQVVEVVAKVTGLVYLKYAYQAAKYAFMGKELYQILISGDFLAVLGPVATAVSDVVRKELGTKGVLNIYYLSCQHELAIKGNQHDSTVSLQTTSTTTPATTLPLKNDIPSTQSASSQPCPLELIDYLGEYLDAGLWLYACKLPAPHKSNGWSSWYTMNLVKRQNWTLLACVGEATKLRDNKKCPAFAMFIRNRSKNDGGLKISTGDKVSEKEVILSIRGSRDPMDWSINLNEAPVPYEYLKGETGETSVQGYVHVGMYEGAIGLLDDYGIRERLLYLHRDKGYPIKVVGHSMGSSVACIVASELKKSLHKKYEFDYQTSISNGIKNVSKARVSLPNDISAIMYAPPPFVCEAVGQAMLEDKLCVGVVNGFDIIPRFSRSNVLSLIKEAKLNTPDADRWYQQDLTSLQSYVSTLGKANDMASGSRHLNTNSSIGTIDESASTEEIVDDGIFDIPEDVTPVSHPVTRTTTTTSTGAGAGTGTAVVLSQTQVETTNTAQAGNPTTMVSSALGSLGTLGSGAASTAANAFGSLSSSLFKARGSTGIEASAPPAHVSVSTHAHAASAPPLPEASAVNISSGKPMKPSRGVSPTAPVMAVSETDMNSKSNLGVNAAISDSSVKESAPPMPEIRMVVPGDIVYLNEEYGHVKATLIDYTAPTMNRILLISSRNVEDHKMFQYVIKMKELRRNHMYHQQRLLVGARDLPVWQDVLLFPSSDDSTSVSVVASVVNESSSATTTTATATAISTSSRATSVATAVTVSESLKDMKSKGIIEQVQNWTPCGVCALDTTWSNVLKSDASRARCTHHCRNCGTVVCTVCSPSGDRLMGEGLTDTVYTSDMKIPIPELGMWEPQRVCMHCLFDCYRDLLTYDGKKSGK